jgi:hypothetical protein
MGDTVLLREKTPSLARQLRKNDVFALVVRLDKSAERVTYC